MAHSLDSSYVRDQLAFRIQALNEKRLQPEGEFVLYWMQSTHRFDDNWALRFATLEADRIGKPLLIHHGLDSAHSLPSARTHSFVLEGARELASQASHTGLTYRFLLSPGKKGDAAFVEQLAARANLVITDLFPTGGVAERSAVVANRVNCRVVAVDSVGVVAAALFQKEEYAARTIRPKIAKLVDLSLEMVIDRPPRRAMPAQLLASFADEWLDVSTCDIDAEVARCRVDKRVERVAIRGGRTAAHSRLDAFVHDGLATYAERRRNPDDEDGTSALSPYLHYGMVSPANVARTVRESVSPEQADAFLGEMITWRELSLNFCLRNRAYASLDALPAWVHGTMAAHARDKREFLYSLEQLESAATHDELWNAGQRELVRTGRMHNVVRMLWGKSVITWAPTYAQAHEWLIHLNDKYALDGRDPNSYAGIQWCFGKFDRPFAQRSVWGTIRPMSLERARSKYKLKQYLERWRA